MGKEHDHFTKHVIGFDIAAAKEIAGWIPDRADVFLQMWLSAGNTALIERPPTTDETTSRNFAVALAGNLLWAATSLFPEGKALIFACSLVGASAGSGVFAKPEPWPIKEINSALAKGRDNVSRKIRGAAKSLALEFVKSGATDHDSRDKALWQHVFPGVVYNSADALLTLMRVAIKGAFDQYQTQYDNWLKDTEAQANKIAAAGPHSTGFVLAKIGDVEGQKTRDRAIVEIRNSKPFHAHFTL